MQESVTHTGKALLFFEFAMMVMWILLIGKSERTFGAGREEKEDGTREMEIVVQ